MKLIFIIPIFAALLSSGCNGTGANTAGKSGASASSGSNGCPVDKAKLEFMVNCEMYLLIQDRDGALGSTPNNREKNKETCRCIAKRFSVEDVPVDATCTYTPRQIREIMTMDKVKLDCR
jgi:hypothetical protein